MRKLILRMSLGPYNSDCNPGGECPAYHTYYDTEGRELEMEHLDWVDMGSPDVITVTIQPGDPAPVDLSGVLTPKEIRGI